MAKEEFKNLYVDNAEMVKVFDAYRNKGYKDGYKNGEKYGILKCATAIKDHMKNTTTIYSEDVDEIVDILINGGTYNGEFTN